MNRNEVAKALLVAEKEFGLVALLHHMFGENIGVKIPFSNTALSLEIDELVLSVRSSNALKRAGIATIGNLLEFISCENLKSLRNLGVKSRKEIQTKLLVFGYDRLMEKEKLAFFRELLDDNIV